MGENSAIGWTDHTFNPWIGCSKVAAGCTNCYAEAFSKRTGRARWGETGTRVVTSDANWREPLKWNRAAEKEGLRRRVFCASLADVFEDWGGPILNHRGAQLGNDGNGQPLTMDDIRVRLFGIIDHTPWLDWLLLTKRPENIESMWPQLAGVPEDLTGDGKRYVPSRNNVWLLTSVATQADVDRNAPLLLECRHLSPVLGLSCEPLLETIDVEKTLLKPAVDCGPCGPDDWNERFVCENGHPARRYLKSEQLGFNACLTCKSPVYMAEPEINWVICGGESGPKRRNVPVEAIEGVARQCVEAGVPCYVKQDVAMRPGQQGRISDATWAIKEFPCVRT